MSALYIHVPFCARKCRYCDFVSFDSKPELAESYFRALWKEIALASNLYELKGVSTVFFGGGTPSFVDQEYIEQTLENVQRTIGIQTGAEITIEANPNSLTKQKLNAYHNAGVNRLSIGLQSADNRLLAEIGRLHTLEMFQAAYEEARNAGFKNINTDVIYALPGQSLDDFRATLETAARLSPEHVSAYSLMIEPGTPMHKDLEEGRIRETDEDTERDMYHAAVCSLESQGFGRYEISNFAKPGFACAHNLAYWNREDYLGLGVAAHSCIRDVRYANTDDIDGYISCLSSGKTAYNNIENLDSKQKETEYIMLKLRLKNGFDTEEYKKMFGRDFRNFFSAPLKKLLKAGLVSFSGSRFHATDKGFDLQNSIVLELLNIL
jgi:oxygen-independent coproporphyrinogen-3 oxidase